jgi:GNAT superfamily N-acetyltransferase
MGSIEAFPRPARVRTLADAWRVAPIPGSGVVRARPARLEDFAAIRALQRLAAPHAAPCSLRQLESRLLAFPEGQMVAVCDGQVVGAASNLVVPWDDRGIDHTWRGVTADGYFTTHDPRAQTLYGAELFVDSSRRGFSAGRTLHQARRRLCRRLNLRRIIATARLPGFAAVREVLTPELYVMRVIWGDIPDAAMRFQMAQGFQYCGILRGYLPEDHDSCGYAALMAWLNPLHAPPGPPAFENSERPRKCA